MLTEIVFILDRSGSMSGLEKDTIGGFNSLIQKQKLEKGEALVSTVLFDHESEVIHDRINILKVNNLTGKEYYVRGSTALLDAIGKSIRHIGNIHKYARKVDIPDKTIFVITTDGMENSSREYTYEKINKMIKNQQEKYGWEFIFLGANIDAIKVASSIGISKEYAANYISDEQGTLTNYRALEKAVGYARKGMKLKECNWKEEIEQDYKKRK